MGMLKAEHGSVMNFILKNRVQWDDLTPRGQPFEYDGTVLLLQVPLTYLELPI